ncbi:MAG: non-canonical purine NTP pyrophosphatase [Candidatus Shapirobacteria bacterium]
MCEILIATTNRSKVEPFLYSCKRLGLDKWYKFLNPKELGLNVEVDENSGSFKGDSELKARAYCQASGIISVSFDRGIEFEGLNYWPGTLTKMAFTGDEKMILGGVENRFEADVAKSREVLARLVGIENRFLWSVYGIAIAFPDGVMVSDEVRVRGKAADDLRITKVGYYYDWFFMPGQSKKTLSEMTPEEYLDYTATVLWPITPRIIEVLKK